MIFRIFSALILFVLTSCGEAGWSGYYRMEKPATYRDEVAYNVGNGAFIKTVNDAELNLGLPQDCSGFKIVGIITPITPPIPLFWFRSWSTADCSYFAIETRPETKVSLRTDNKIYTPETISKRNHYEGDETFIYTFPIRAKNIDSGILILEKNGEKIEVPFEYKYFRFWH